MNSILLTPTLNYLSLVPSSHSSPILPSSINVSLCVKYYGRNKCIAQGGTAFLKQGIFFSSGQQINLWSKLVCEFWWTIHFWFEVCGIFLVCIKAQLRFSPAERFCHYSQIARTHTQIFHRFCWVLSKMQCILAWWGESEIRSFH